MLGKDVPWISGFVLHGEHDGSLLSHGDIYLEAKLNELKLCRSVNVVRTNYIRA